MHWENWKINSGIGKRKKNPDIQLGLLGTQVCAFSLCKAFKAATAPAAACSRGQAGGTGYHKGSDPAESKVMSLLCYYCFFFFFASPILPLLCQQRCLKPSPEVPGGCGHRWAPSLLLRSGMCA